MSMATENLLVELFVEELPPKALKNWDSLLLVCWPTASKHKA